MEENNGFTFSRQQLLKPVSLNNLYKYCSLLFISILYIKKICIII